MPVLAWNLVMLTAKARASFDNGFRDGHRRKEELSAARVRSLLAASISACDGEMTHVCACVRARARVCVCVCVCVYIIKSMCGIELIADDSAAMH